MNIAVIGCGAMGSIYAGLLAHAGHDVLAIDGWQAHVQAINEHGLRVEGASGDKTLRIRASMEPPEHPVDMVIIATKALQIAEAAHKARPLVGANTCVIALQNGLGSDEQVADILGGERLIVGIAAAFGASLKGPGHAHHNGMALIRLGAYADLPMAEVEQAAAVWREAGFNAHAVGDIQAMQWEKLICNVAYSAPCAISGLTVGQAMDDPYIGEVSRMAAAEAWEVARARGIALDIDDPVAHVRAFASRIPDARPSVHQDLMAGRRSEIDVINGAIPREAARCGMQAPVNTVLTALVHFHEAGGGSIDKREAT